MATQKLRFDDFDNNFSKTLSSAINDTDLTIYLSGVPAKATEGYLVLNSDDLSKYEIIYFNVVGANYVSVPASGGRGQGGTSARAHDAGAPVKMYFLGEHFKALRDAVFTGFFELNYVPVYASASTITIPTDVSALFTAGRKLKITFATSGVKYFTVERAATYANPNTTVTLFGDTVVNEAITKIEMDVNPQSYSDNDMLVLNEKSASPATPESGNAFLYQRDNGITYIKNDAGEEIPLISPLSFIQRQGIINGGMEISQENATSTVALVNNTAKYACDLFSITPSGTAVSAGTQAQIANSTIGTSGYALKLAGVTITGAGTIKKRYRVEAADAVRYKNKPASFSLLELQDTGGSLNYTIQINKANSNNNFAAVTQIAISGNLAVPSGAETLIKLENVLMGDCSNGIEILVTIPCGAITTKNFETTEWQMNVGAVVLPFVCASVCEELSKVLRFFEKLGTMSNGLWISATTARIYLNFKIPKRSTARTFAIATTTPGIEKSGVLLRTGSGSVIVASSTGVSTAFVEINGFTGAAYGEFAQMSGDYINVDARFTA